MWLTYSKQSINGRYFMYHSVCFQQKKKKKCILGLGKLRERRTLLAVRAEQRPPGGATVW